VLPDELTLSVVDDVFHANEWQKHGRLAGSKKMKVALGHYPQESLSNEAMLCINYILDHWQELGHLVNEIPLLKEMWDLAQESGGACIYPDEVLTYALEKPINDEKYGAWIDVARDIFKNGPPSDKYLDYYMSKCIEDFPLAWKDNNASNGYMKHYRNRDDAIEIIDLPLDEQINNFRSLCEKFLKEDVANSPCWKKIAICILKNDTTMKYAGFAPTLRERIARQEAIAAFSTKQKEKDKAVADAKVLVERMKKQRQ
jgi:hypothetical protein